MQNNIMMPCDKIFSIIEVKLAHLLFPHNDEIVALTDKITCELLIQAYNQGYFPWPFDSCDLIPWYNPRKRGILEFTDLIIPKSWLKLKRQKELYCSLNKDFESVITHCRDVHQSRNDNTWINEHIIQAYSELHRRGMALSVEVWEKDQLIGGLYGVDINRLFTGESMFYLKSGASKIGLLYLIDILKARGDDMMDIQMVTPLFEIIGGKYISRNEFQQKLKIKQEVKN